MAVLTEKQAKLFLDPNFGHLGTIRPDGSTQVTPVWVDYDGENVVFNTAVGRAKYRYMKRDPRVTLEVTSREDPYRYIMVSGTVEMQEGEEAERHIDKLAKKYLGRELYPGRRPDERRVIVRVRPERVFPKEGG